MKKKESAKTKSFRELRNRAEKLRRKRPLNTQTSLLKDYQELVQELQTHQIELELQNEELRKTQTELEDSRQKYFELFDFAPVGYFLFDRQGMILEVNLTGARLLGTDRSHLMNERFTRFIDSEYQDVYYLHRRNVFQSPKKQSCDLKLVTPDGTHSYVRLESVAVPHEMGHRRQFRTTATDITESVQMAEALHQSEEHYKLLFTDMVSGCAMHEIILDPYGKPVDSRLLEVNQAFERLTGTTRDQVIGKTLLEVWPGTEPYWIESFGEVALTGKPMLFENYHRDLDKYFAVSVFRPKPGHVAITFTDITDRKHFEIELQRAHDELEKRVKKRTIELASSNESLKQEIADRKKAEKALEAERQRLFSVLDELPAFVYLQDSDYSIRFANRYFKDRFGAIEGKKCHDLLKGLKEPCQVCLTFEVFETGEPQTWDSSELRDNRIYQIYDYPFTDTDGSSLVLEVGIDITKQKQAEAERRRLSSRILNAQEDERRRIALELHDELGQDLSVLKLQLDAIKRQLSEDQIALKENLEAILLDVNKTIEKVRGLSHELSPSILVDLGLNSALRWLIQSLRSHSRIEMTTDILDIKNLFSIEQEIVIYRIFQEVFTNIRKHARATQVSIKVRRDDSMVFFKVEDNGIGFDMQQIKAQYAPERGLGLAAMEERVKMLDGHFEIFGEVGQGTAITFEIPIAGSP